MKESAEYIKQIEEALNYYQDIVAESAGLAGYHLNGNIALWGEFELPIIVVEVATIAGWTTAQPTEPGYYWWRRNSCDNSPSPLLVYETFGDKLSTCKGLITEHKGEWWSVRLIVPDGE